MTYQQLTNREEIISHNITGNQN